MLIRITLPPDLEDVSAQIEGQLALHGYQMTGVALGRGSYGTTLLVERGGTLYAVKIAQTVGQQRQEQEERERLARHEARLALALGQQRHVVGAVDAWEAPPLFFLVMPYVQGRTLRDLVKQGQVAEQDLCDLGCQIAEGLIALHQQGVIHRDLTPSNVLVTPDGVAHIIDFNIAKDAQGTLQGFSRYGTPPFCAGEQYLGTTNEQTDQYAWGMLLAAMALGTVELPDALQRGKRPLALRASDPTISAALEEVIERAAHPDPAQRFPDLCAARSALGQVSQKLSQPVPVPAAKVAPALPGKTFPTPRAHHCPQCAHAHSALPAFCEACGAAVDPDVARQVARQVDSAGAPSVGAVTRGQPPFQVAPGRQLVALFLGGPPQFPGGKGLSWAGRLMTVWHYVVILAALFFGGGFVATWWTRCLQVTQATMLLFLLLAIGWLFVRFFGDGAAPLMRRNYMGRWHRCGAVLVVEGVCALAGGLSSHALAVLGTGASLGLVLAALVCLANALLNYYALELWMN